MQIMHLTPRYLCKLWTFQIMHVMDLTPHYAVKDLTPHHKKTGKKENIILNCVQHSAFFFYDRDHLLLLLYYYYIIIILLQYKKKKKQ